MSRDLKEALSSGRKPDITHVRGPFKTYTARPCEYGSAKYVRGNFLRPAAPEGALLSARTRANFERFRAYLRAAASHIDATLDAMERHQARDGELTDVRGMVQAAYAVDTDAKPGCPVGPSLLPHVAHACASLMMAVTQAVDFGLLPEDPGRPWETKMVSLGFLGHERAEAAMSDPPQVNPAAVRDFDANDIIVTLNGVRIEGFAPGNFVSVVGTETSDEKALLDAVERRADFGGPGGIR